MKKYAKQFAGARLIYTKEARDICETDCALRRQYKLFAITACIDELKIRWAFKINAFIRRRRADELLKLDI
jgi:hypothetical protein